MKRILLIAGLILFCVAGFYGYQFYHKAFSVNTPSVLDNNILLIQEGAVLEDVIDSLVANGQILKEDHFRWTAGKMNYYDAVSYTHLTLPTSDLV